MRKLLQKAAHVIAGKKFSARGGEIPDPTKMEIPAGFGRPETLEERMRRLIRVHVSMAAQAGGSETLEEANDFDIPDDDPTGIETQHTFTALALESPDGRFAEAADDAGDSGEDRGTRRNGGPGGEAGDDEPAEDGDVPEGSDVRDLGEQRRARPSDVRRGAAGKPVLPADRAGVSSRAGAKGRAVNR